MSTARGVWLGTAASLFSFTLRFSLFSLLYFYHPNSVSQIGFWFWFDLEGDLSDSLKASQCRVNHKNKRKRDGGYYRLQGGGGDKQQRKGKSENERERRENEEVRREREIGRAHV